MNAGTCAICIGTALLVGLLQVFLSDGAALDEETQCTFVRWSSPEDRESFIAVQCEGREEEYRTTNVAIVRHFAENPTQVWKGKLRL